MGKTREKMSKSRGNVVTIDEVVGGVSEIDSDYEFRVQVGPDEMRALVDYRKVGVWRCGIDYFTSTRLGKLPVYLCRKGVDGPCTLLIDGVEREQHQEIKE